MKSRNVQWSRAGIAAAWFGMVAVSGAAWSMPDITVKYTPLETCCGILTPSLSADGRYVAYRSASSTAGVVDIFITDLQTGVRTQANRMVTGGVPTNAQCDTPAISADGRYVIFGCTAAPMGSEVPTAGQAYYVYDRINDKTEMIPMPGGGRVSRSAAAAISKDGHYVAFRAYDAATNYTLYVRNMVSKTTVATAAKAVFVGTTPAYLSISDDGRYISYNGRPNTSNAATNVYVYDVSTGVSELINVSTAGVAGTKGGGTPIMSSDGNVVSFMSGDTALTVPAAPSTTGSVFVRDRRAGTTEFVSGAATAGYTNFNSMSANGRYIAFTGNPSSSVKNLYVYDRLTKISRIVPGAITNLHSASYTSFTPDGRYLAIEIAGLNATQPARSIGLADLGVAAGLSLSANTLSLTEGGAAGTYTAVLTQVPTANVTLTIKPDAQLTLARTQLTFTPENWNVPQVVSVQAVQDGVAEGVHKGALTHTVTSSDVYYTVISPAPVNVVISDAVVPTIVLPPAADWNKSELPLTGTASPGATVLLTAVNRDTGWLTSVSVVADAQGSWSYTLTGLTSGVFDLDAQADGIKSAVATVTITLPVN